MESCGKGLSLLHHVCILYRGNEQLNASNTQELEELDLENLLHSGFFTHVSGIWAGLTKDGTQMGLMTRVPSHVAFLYGFGFSQHREQASQEN